MPPGYSSISQMVGIDHIYVAINPTRKEMASLYELVTSGAQKCVNLLLDCLASAHQCGKLTLPILLLPCAVDCGLRRTVRAS